MAVDTRRLAADAARRFGHGPDVVARAPGRVNLIGEHTDYNEGFVLPTTVDFDVVVAAAARADRALRLYSTDYDQIVSVSLDDLRANGLPLWARYPAGVADVLQKAGHRLDGADLAMTGDVPRGAGLSSSAAIEMATITAFCELEGLDIDPVARVLLARQAENEFVGVPCGVMDQFVSGLGAEASALLIDCRSYEYERVPLELADEKIVICDTRKKRALAASAYEQRVRECAEGVERLSGILGRPLKALRDVSAVEFFKVEDRLPETIRRRCRHIVTENDRVTNAVAALKDGRLEIFGRLMNASHASMRDDYEISCDELNEVVEAANAVDGVLGSRLTGAGFGGCAVHLARESAVEALRASVVERYYQPRGLEPGIYICEPSPGACRVEQ